MEEENTTLREFYYKVNGIAGHSIFDTNVSLTSVMDDIRCAIREVKDKLKEIT